MNTSHRDDGASVAQYRAVSACAVVRVAAICRSSLSAVVNGALPGIGGGAGRYALPDGITHVIHAPAPGSNGLATRRGGVGRQAQSSVGTVPAQEMSAPSALARAIAFNATARPIFVPASTSLG